MKICNSALILFEIITLELQIKKLKIAFQSKLIMNIQ